MSKFCSSHIEQAYRSSEPSSHVPHVCELPIAPYVLYITYLLECILVVYLWVQSTIILSLSSYKWLCHWIIEMFMNKRILVFTFVLHLMYLIIDFFVKTYVVERQIWILPVLKEMFYSLYKLLWIGFKITASHWYLVNIK